MLNRFFISRETQSNEDMKRLPFYNGKVFILKANIIYSYLLFESVYPVNMKPAYQSSTNTMILKISCNMSLRGYMID